VPAFVRLSDGSVVGDPTPASPEDTVAINPRPPSLPASLSPDPIIIKVRAQQVAQGQSAQQTPQAPRTHKAHHAAGARR
jgi:hypothetical protein